MSLPSQSWFHSLNLADGIIEIFHLYRLWSRSWVIYEGAVNLPSFHICYKYWTVFVKGCCFVFPLCKGYLLPLKGNLIQDQIIQVYRLQISTGCTYPDPQTGDCHGCFPAAFPGQYMLTVLESGAMMGSHQE